MGKYVVTIPKCHPDKKHEARGLCKACYENLRIYGDPGKRIAKQTRDRQWREKNYIPPIPKPKQGPPSCHPDRKPFARKMCVECYRYWWRHVHNPTYYTRTNVAHRYKISLAEYDSLLSRGVCDICKKKPKSLKQRDLVIDHDHDTGKVRGVLCRKCNVMLAIYQSPKWQKLFDDYLEQASK